MPEPGKLQIFARITNDFPCITEEAQVCEVKVKVQPLHDGQDLHQAVVGVPEMELVVNLS